MQKRENISNLLVRLKFSALMALDGITSNLLRTFLTVLGISIGVAAVISLTGIGEGARRSIVEQFESLGENVIVSYVIFLLKYKVAVNDEVIVTIDVQFVQIHNLPVTHIINMLD
jgi:ABC-type antimicrobial peptide transport system permease subunit